MERCEQDGCLHFVASMLTATKTKLFLYITLCFPADGKRT